MTMGYEPVTNRVSPKRLDIYSVYRRAYIYIALFAYFCVRDGITLNVSIAKTYSESQHLSQS